MACCFRVFPALLLAIALIVPAAAYGQPQPAPGAAPAVSAVPLSQDQFDALLAPIALYPDQLLTQVLMASTYPLEVVEAARFLQQNPSLQGEALDQALLGRNWDPSVQSLAAFPQVLAMMNDKLEWTQQLGDAFLAYEPQVMETVQLLRVKAQAAGNLQSTPQQNVVVQERYIYIEPAEPQVVYVPVYNPAIVYGPWWAPAYRPWYWYPPPIYGYPPLPLGSVLAAGIFWGTAWAITRNNWGWCQPNWGGRSININVNNNTNIFINNRNYRERYSSGQWQHQPDHRRGVAYRDPVTRDRYQRPNNAGANTRENYRGYDGTRPAPRPVSDRPPAGNAGGSGGGGSVTRPGERPNVPGTRPGGETPGTGTSARPSPPSTGPAERPATPSTRPAPAAPPSTTRPAPQPSPPVFNTKEPRPQVQMESNRGQASRQAMTRPPTPAAPRPQVQPAAPAPRPQAQPASPAPRPQGQPADRSGGASGARSGAPQRGQP